MNEVMFLSSGHQDEGVARDIADNASSMASPTASSFSFAAPEASRRRNKAQPFASSDTSTALFFCGGVGEHRQHPTTQCAPRMPPLLPPPPVHLAPFRKKHS